MPKPAELQVIYHPDDGEGAALTLAAHRSDQHGGPFTVLQHQDDESSWGVAAGEAYPRTDEWKAVYVVRAV